MRSPKSVRRPHIRQQLTNRRKNLGRVAKSQQNQFRQWLLTAVLPNSINELRKQAFASLELTEQPQKVEKVKKADKKKAQKQIAKDHEAEKQQNAKKAAEKESRRAAAEAKKRAAEEEEHKKWKAEQAKIQKEQEKKEAELKKLQADEKKKKAEKAEKAEKAKKEKKTSPAPVEEVVVKKVAKVEQAAPEPKTPTNTPAEPVEEAVQEVTTGKKNKKNKKKSESEATPAAPAPAEQVVEQPAVVADEPQQQAPAQGKKNKKDKKKSESEAAPAAPAPVEQVVEKSKKKSKKNSESDSQAPVVAPVSKKPTADDSMDFLDFVSKKPEPEPVVEEKPAVVETTKEEKSSKKNKKNKKNSESEKNGASVVESAHVEVPQPVSETVVDAAQPFEVVAAPSAKPTADDLGFLDFVTPKAEQPEVVVETSAPQVEEPLAAVSKKPTAEDMEFLDFDTAKADVEQPAVARPSESLDDLEIVTYDQVADAIPAVSPQVEKVVAPAQSSSPSPNSVLLNRPSKGKKKHHKKTKKHSESEQSQEPSQEDLEFLEFLRADHKEKVEEVAAPAATSPTAAAPAPVSQKPTADSMDFLDFVTAKPEKTEVEEHIEAPKVVAPVQAENEVDSDVALDFEIVDAEEVAELLSAPEITVEESAGKKKNKKNKNKKNSESEATTPPAKEATPEVVEEVFEKKIVSPSTEAAAPAAPAQKEGKNKKKNKKGSGNSESHEAAPAEPAPTVEIPHVAVDAGKGSPGSDKENSGAVNGTAKKQASVEELDYGQTTDVSAGTDKKNKKKNKKGKNSNSISENAQVIAHLEQDHLDQLADDEVQAITGGSHSPPIQVHEVTSSEQQANGQIIEKTTTIEITQTLDDSNMSQTQFQKNVEKLVQAQLAKHDIVEVDPTVKLRIDAQLIKLSEKKAPAVVMEHVNYIKPLPMELHISRPSTPSRDRVYKLLPKDILFCAGLIDSHGDNYAAMAADERNLFKDTSRALQRKIRIFKESPHYQTYLRAKGENRSLEEVLAAEAN